MAPALQLGLGAIGKPWFQRRARRVFRDLTSLSASPELWPTIERALECSRYFILLASSDSARSQWVEQEVNWWRTHRASDTLLIVLTDGELRWDESAGDFSNSSALPPSARGWFAVEPLWVDLRWARTAEHVSLRNSRFRDDVASLAAPISGAEKDELVGEDVRQHQRTVRLARAAVGILGVLTLVAIAGGILAELQRREAQRQLREATSLALSVSSVKPLTPRPDVSLALAFEGYRSSARSEARAAVTRALVAARASGMRGLIATHDDSVFDLAISPDGNLLATASSEGTVRLWNLATHTQIRRIAGRGLQVYRVVFSPDGRTLAFCGADGYVHLWDVRTGKLERPLTGRRDQFFTVAFSPDGSILAGASGGTVMFWDAMTRAPLGSLDKRAAGVQTVAFSPDGKTLATGGDVGAIRLWDVASRTQLGVLRAGARHVGTVTFSPNGKMLASAADGTVRLWDALTKKQIARVSRDFDGFEVDAVAAVAFSPDSRTLAFAGDGANFAVRVWDVATRKLIKALGGHVDEVTAMAFSPDGRTLATTGLDGTVRLTDPTFHPQPGSLRIPALVAAIAFSPDGRTVAASGMGSGVRLWNSATHKLEGRLRDHDLNDELTYAPSIAFSPDGRTIATADVTIVSKDGGIVRLWDSATHTLVAELAGHTGAVNAVAFNPKGKTLASVGDDGTVRLWDPATHAQLSRLDAHDGPLAAVAFTRDGRTIAYGGKSGTVRLWNPVDRKPLGRLAPHNGAITSLSIA